MDLYDWMRHTYAAQLRQYRHFLNGCKAARIDLVADLLRKGVIR
jgi:hypothetical protein